MTEILILLRGGHREVEVLIDGEPSGPDDDVSVAIVDGSVPLHEKLATGHTLLATKILIDWYKRPFGLRPVEEKGEWLSKDPK